MKKPTLTILLLFHTIILIGQKNDFKDILSIAEINEQTFENSGTIENPAIDFSMVKKENGIINIPNKNKSGSFVTFTDDVRPEENKVKNEYFGYYSSIQKHLIRTQYYEGTEFILIGNYNNRTSIWSTPVFSQNYRYFFTFKSYGLEGGPVGLQIWEVVENKYSRDNLSLNKVLELNQLLFNPIELKWNVDNSILIKGQIFENHKYSNNDAEIRYWRLIFN